MLWRRVNVEPSAGFIRYFCVAVVITMFGYSLGYSTIGFGLLFLGTAWHLFRYRGLLWTRTALDLPLTVFAAVLIVSAAASPYQRVAVGVTLMLLISGIVYFGAFAWLFRVVPGLREGLLKAWALGGVVAAAVGVACNASAYGFVGPKGWAPARAAIPRGVGPNGLGTTLMLASIVSLGLAVRTRGRERVLWSVAAVVCLAGLLASGSRASLGGWLAGAAYAAWRQLRTRPGVMAAVAIVGLLLLVGIGSHTPQIADRLGHTMSDINGNRVKIWHTSLAMIGAHPALGTGFGTFERAYNERRAPDMSPEPFAFNLWLNLAVETGLLGLAAALWVGVGAVRTWHLNAFGLEHDGWRPTIAALWIALLVDQFADNTLFSISTSAALWLLLAFTATRSSTPGPDEPRESPRTEGSAPPPRRKEGRKRDRIGPAVRRNAVPAGAIAAAAAAAIVIGVISLRQYGWSFRPAASSQTALNHAAPPKAVEGAATSPGAAHAATVTLEGLLRAYFAKHGCYPATPWLDIAGGFGVAPNGITGSWPPDQRYGAFDSSGAPLADAGTAYYVGVVWRPDWQAHGGGYTNPGYVWIVNGHSVPVCER
jgi:O-antigen ligase